MRLPLLVLHILGGTIGLLAGTLAVAVRKGGYLHRVAGNIFTLGMLTLAGSGLWLSILKSQRGNVIGAIATFYLIATAWRAGRSRDQPGLFDRIALVFGVAGGIGALTLGVFTLRNPTSAEVSAPPAMSLFFGFILLLAAAGDIRMIVRGGFAGRQRITRHLWRMCFGLFIATGSFFLGQQQVFPSFLRGSMLLTVLALLPLPLLIYWLMRVRFSKAYSLRFPTNPVQVAP